MLSEEVSSTSEEFINNEPQLETQIIFDTLEFFRNNNNEELTSYKTYNYNTTLNTINDSIDLISFANYDSISSILKRETFGLINKKLVYAIEEEITYFQNPIDSLTWACEYLINNDKIVFFESLGHGKSEDENWNIEYILSSWKNKRYIFNEEVGQFTTPFINEGCNDDFNTSGSSGNLRTIYDSLLRIRQQKFDTKNLSLFANKYYNKSVHLTDDCNTFNLISDCYYSDSPEYGIIWNMVLTESDASVSEYLSSYTQSYFELHPYQVLHELSLLPTNIRRNILIEYRNLSFGGDKSTIHPNDVLRLKGYHTDRILNKCSDCSEQEQRVLAEYIDLLYK